MCSKGMIEMDYTEVPPGIDFILEKYNGPGVITRRMDTSINVRYTTMDEDVAISFKEYLKYLFLGNDVEILKVPCDDGGFDISIIFE
jgi:hypothetical protein